MVRDRYCILPAECGFSHKDNLLKHESLANATLAMYTERSGLHLEECPSFHIHCTGYDVKSFCWLQTLVILKQVAESL